VGGGLEGIGSLWGRSWVVEMCCLGGCFLWRRENYSFKMGSIASNFSMTKVGGG